MAITTYTADELKILNIALKATPGQEYIQDNGQGTGSLWIGRRNGTLQFVRDNIDLRAQIAVGEILENTANISLTYDTESNEIFSDLEETGVVAGTYGDAQNTPQITVDEDGRVTDVQLSPIDNDKVKVTTNDTTPNFLGLKLAAGLNITLTVLNPGANEQLKIDGAAAPAAYILSVSDTPTIDLTVSGAGDLTANFIGDSDDVPEGSTNLYFLEARVLASILAGLSVSGGTITAADNVLGAFGKLQNQINSLVGGVLYKGTWNATTNSPALASGVGTKGWYYVVSVAGATNLDGITDWKLGDWAIFNGTVWEKVDNTDAVISVNGFTGTVVLTTTDVTEGVNLYYTAARVLATALSGYVSGAGTITSLDTVLSAIQKLNGNISALTTGVSSVYGRTGAVVAVSGDYDTSMVTELTNLYFTNARVIASTLTAYASGAGTISSADSILQAIQKLNGNILALITGVSSVNGATGVVVVTVTGTVNRISITGGTGTTPTIDISTSYAGQGTITTLGTITTGVWNGTAIPVANGGTAATTAAGARTNLGIAVPLMMGHGSFNPADAATVLIGCLFAVAPNIGGTVSRFRAEAPITGIVTRVRVTRTMTAGTTETATLKLNNKTAGTSVTLDSAYVFNNSINLYTSLSFAVTLGDELEIELDCPTWATNPTTVSQTFQLLINY